MDMDKIMQQAQQLQQRMSVVQNELAKQKITSSVGGGMVTAVVNGKNELLEIKIEKEVIDADDPAMLQDLIVAAVNDAMQKSKEAAQGEMSKLTGGLNMNIPGLAGMFGA
ncbi:MAG: YbaB/EbfC family nucleoid-associated protein [Deltaproteobacteria bacterium]|nr:YbaB/EbfC family nucleoid-associated protein [Deltaproteobacteria bacterium]